MATAVQVESIWNGLTDNNGQPLAAGKVYTYSAGTTTPVSLFTASDKSTSATNPLILDAYGKAQVWADGRYKFVVKTSADVTLYTLDNLLYGFDDTTILYGGTSTGAANAQVVSVPATVTSYANGQTISFVAGYTNTGATTIQFNSLSAISLVKGNTPSSLQAGDLIAGQLYTATYHGGSFRLQDYPSVADVQRSRFLLASSVAGTNTITANLSPAPSSYETGMVVTLVAANANTGASTLNLNSLGAKAIQRQGTALVGNEIKAGDVVQVFYDGTQFQLLNVAPAPLFVDRVNSRVGIGTTSPGTQLHISSATDASIRIEGTGGADNDQSIHFKDTTSNWYIGNRYGGGSPNNTTFGIGTTASKDQFRFESGNQMLINTDGNNIIRFRGNYNTASPFQSRLQISSNWNYATGAADSSGNGTAAIAVEGGASNYGAITFSTNINNTVPVERVRIDSNGYVSIGTNGGLGALTVNGAAYFKGQGNATLFSSSGCAAYIGYQGLGNEFGLSFRNAADGSTAILFSNAAGVTVGNVAQGASSVSYNTTSDYRLKTNIAPMIGALSRVSLLKPCTFDWVNTNEPSEGFIAHELATVLPEAVSGEKDAVDADGNPRYQGVDYGKLTTILTAAIQELNAKVEALEARVAALEAV